MKINHFHNVNAANAYNKAQGNIRQDTAKKAAKPKDEVQISNEAQSMLKNNQAISKEERLNQLKQQVADGTYRVDADKIADKLMAYLRHQEES